MTPTCDEEEASRPYIHDINANWDQHAGSMGWISINIDKISLMPMGGTR